MSEIINRGGLQFSVDLSWEKIRNGRYVKWISVDMGEVYGFNYPYWMIIGRINYQIREIKPNYYRSVMVVLIEDQPTTPILINTTKQGVDMIIDRFVEWFNDNTLVK